VAIDIRPVPEADQRTWLEAVETTFADELRDERWQLLRPVLPVDRVLGAYDGEAIVGGGAAFSLSLTVPGGQAVPTAGVTAVGILPTHRRQGALRQLMTRQLADVRRRSEPLAALWASEGSIYQRFGYGLASLNGGFEIERERTSFRAEQPDGGAMRLIDAAEAARLLPPIYDAVCARTPGFYARSAVWWQANLLADPENERRGASRQFIALHERGDGPAGYALYRVQPDWGPIGSQSVLLAREVIGLDPAAERRLWRYLFGVDLIARIRARLGPARHPLLLMLAEPRRLALGVKDGLWLRIVDVEAALAARSYAEDGSVVIEVIDEFMPAAAGRWRLRVAGGRGRVESTSDAAELLLDTTDLSAVYLGAFSFADLARAGRTEELAVSARARADRLFATDVTPWCPEVF
jgi:predicted acetyltransferase